MYIGEIKLTVNCTILSGDGAQHCHEIKHIQSPKQIIQKNKRAPSKRLSAPSVRKRLLDIQKFNNLQSETLKKTKLRYQTLIRII
jgi:hypothetical protein